MALPSGTKPLPEAMLAQLYVRRHMASLGHNELNHTVKLGSYERTPFKTFYATVFFNTFTSWIIFNSSCVENMLMCWTGDVVSGVPWYVSIPCTVYPKKYAHGFVVLCFVVVMQSFIMNSYEVFIHIHQGCFAGTGAIVRLPQCQWSKPDGYWKISQCITTTKHSKAKKRVHISWDILYNTAYLSAWNLATHSTNGLPPSDTQRQHDDVIKWKHFPRYWPFDQVTGEFPAQMPVTRSFDVFFDLRLE